MKILELGCGINKTEGAFGIDINPRSSADLIHDLNDLPYPLDANSYDLIICRSILEHLDNVIEVMEELHRLGKSGSLVKVTVPFFRSWAACTDPTHKRFFSSRSFDYFDKSKPLYELFPYSECFYSIEKVEYKKFLAGKLKFYDKLFLKISNKRKVLFEDRLHFLFIPDEIYFEMRIIK